MPALILLGGPPVVDSYSKVILVHIGGTWMGGQFLTRLRLENSTAI